MSFKKDFVWGAATAAYQIEGAAFTDGRKASVWDECTHHTKYIKLGATGDVACDHYNRCNEDLDIMKEVGLQAYRFSFSWPRIIPDGVGAINPKGLEFYDRLIDGLLERNITPYATLFHWDFPLELYHRGGWLNPDSSKWFEEYAAVIANRYSDRIKNWMTINEPQCFIEFGHSQGIHAPFLKLPFSQILLAAHNVLLAHGRAAKVLRDAGSSDTRIGYAPVGAITTPESEKDAELARKLTLSITEENLFLANTWWSDPMFLGQYPEDGLKLFEKHLPKFGQDDMKIIHQPLDFYGVNIYNAQRIIKSENAEVKTITDPYAPVNAFDCPLTPDVLYWASKFFYDRYQKPIIITENGMCGTDYVNRQGKVIDDHRIVYTEQYLAGLKKAAAEGIPIDGYFHWSMFDNFEWAEGYTKRFGLVHVDYHNGTRTIKESGKWYKNVIATNGEQI